MSSRRRREEGLWRMGYQMGWTWAAGREETPSGCLTRCLGLEDGEGAGPAEVEDSRQQDSRLAEPTYVEDREET